jgi:hypothetical protein
VTKRASAGERRSVLGDRERVPFARCARCGDGRAYATKAEKPADPAAVLCIACEAEAALPRGELLTLAARRRARLAHALYLAGQSSALLAQLQSLAPGEGHEGGDA